MASLGVDRFRRETIEAQQRGEATSSRGMHFILQHVIAPTSAAIGFFRKSAGGGAPGRRHSVIRLVTSTPPDVLAYLTTKIVLDSFVQEQPLAATAVRVGAAIEVEQRIDAFSEQAYVKKVIADLDQRTSNLEHKRKVMVGLLRTKGDNWTSWTKSEQLHVGVKMIELMIEATRIATIEHRRENRRTRLILALTPAFRAWLTNLNVQLEVMHPEFMPCVVPPKDWAGLEGGGYHTDAFMRPPSLVKTWSRDHVARLKVADLSIVLRGVNAIQSTPWAVNSRVLAVFEEVVARGLDLGILPPLEDLPIPPAPVGIPEDPAERTEVQVATLTDWKRAARETYTTNEKLTSKRLQVYKVLGLAKEFATYPAIYFPHQLDFRGRAYPIPQLLNPQGADFAKGLLGFAEGAPLDTDRAVGWWLIHGATTFGIDKVSMTDRLDWVQDNHDRIIRSAIDPLEELWWTEADGGDAAWRFLAWCFEYAHRHALASHWVDADERLALFRTYLPLAKDGTCNGLQHYSAMLLDPVGGGAVNLVPGDHPEDIYGEVAKVVIQKLWAETGDNAMTAALWGEWGIDRKITKRPVMVLPYGGTYASCQKYVLEVVQEQIAGGKPNPFGDDLRAACGYLASVVWASIGDVVVAARAGMGWLMDVARIASHDSRPVAWTAPSGFPVLQAYPEMRSRRVDTSIHGSMIQLNLSEEVEGKIDKRRQANGIAPNFVHSMDASALMLTVNLALDNGVTRFAMIHDSYGTDAQHTDMLDACTRHAFVNQYTEHEVLAEFRAGILPTLSPKAAAKLPSVPTAGGLDLSQVVHSQFFFA